MENGLYSNWLPDERYTWRREIILGAWHEPFVLQQYRAHRDSNLWRSTREVEKLCEYILHLEGATDMSESFIVICDNCQKDLSTSDKYPKYSLRMMETSIRAKSDATLDPDSKPELDAIKNYCNLACLKEWFHVEAVCNEE